VSKKWPMWLVPNCISKPSSVFNAGVAITPALFTNAWRGSWRSLKSLTKARTDENDAKSNGMVSTSVLPVLSRMRSAAASALLAVRQASITCAPCLANTRAASKPTPVLAPVTTTVRPSREISRAAFSAVVRLPSPLLAEFPIFYICGECVGR
jgi:hypothetical protein